MGRTSKAKLSKLQAANDRLRSMTVDNTFARPLRPSEPGTVREKRWRRSTVNLLSGDAELDAWDKRAIEYWALQGLKYGWVIDLDNTQTVLAGEHVISRAMVVHVVPGTRISEEQWRSNNPPAKVTALLGLDR